MRVLGTQYVSRGQDPQFVTDVGAFWTHRPLRHEQFVTPHEPLPVQAVQTLLTQSAEMQSFRVLHVLLSAQRGQEPPQSTSLSSPFLTVSLQVGRLGHGCTQPSRVGANGQPVMSMQISPCTQSPQVATARTTGAVAAQKGAPSALTAQTQSAPPV